MRDECTLLLAEQKEALLDGSKHPLEFQHVWRQVVSQLPELDASELGIAIHEAGHAVMCWLVECSFEHVSIIPEEGSLGHLLHKPFPEHG